MKLGIINGWSEGCIKYVRDKGLDAVEFCVNHNYDSKDFLSKANEIKSYSEKYGVPVGSMGRWGMKRNNSRSASGRQKHNNRRFNYRLPRFQLRHQLHKQQKL